MLYSYLQKAAFKLPFLFENTTIFPTFFVTYYCRIRTLACIKILNPKVKYENILPFDLSNHF
jgi:hypothetical protein